MTTTITTNSNSAAASRAKERVRIIAAPSVIRYCGTSALYCSPLARTIPQGPTSQSVLAVSAALALLLLALVLVQAGADRVERYQSAAQRRADAAYRVDVRVQRYRAAVSADHIAAPDVAGQTQPRASPPTCLVRSAR
jgi:hypothetical protein